MFSRCLSIHYIPIRLTNLCDPLSVEWIEMKRAKSERRWKKMQNCDIKMKLDYLVWKYELLQSIDISFHFHEAHYCDVRVLW